MKKYKCFLIATAILLSACSPFSQQDEPGDVLRVVVEGFYSWYIEYASRVGLDDVGNPLVERAYRQRPELSPEFVQNMDALLDANEFLGYDPFLCAQDILQQIVVDGWQINGQDVLLKINSSFTGHSFQVALRKQDSQWFINDVLCQ